MRRAFSGRRFETIVVAAYAAVLLVGIWHHELWRDEIDSWLLARDSASPAELLRNMHYEGHPALWHLLLLPLTRMFHDPVAMQAAQWLIAVTTAAVVMFCAPFDRATRVLVCFGYYFVFEYGVIARGYGLGVLLLMTAVVASRRRSFVAAGFLLALAANTSIYALIIAAALVIGLLVEQLLVTRSDHGRVAVAAVIASTGFIVAFAQIVRAMPPQASHRDIRQILQQFDHTSLRALQSGWLPIPNFSAAHVWNTELLTHRFFAAHANVIGGMLTLLFSALAVWAFRRRAAALIVFATGTAMLGVFAAFYFNGTVRHHGHFFVLLILCSWVAGAVPRFLVPLLALHAALGGWFVCEDVRLRFAPERAAADWLSEHGFADGPMAAIRASRGGPLSAFLPHRVYFLQMEKEGTFVSDPRGGIVLTPAEIADRVQRWPARNPERILISHYPLATTLANFRLEPLQSFAENMADEELYLYAVRGASR